MVEHSASAPQIEAIVLVEEVLSPNEEDSFDISDVEDLFDDLSQAISRQRAEVKKRQHKDKRTNS